MSTYPLLNYNWIDASSNMLPIANSTFAYGTLGISSTSIGTYWSSLTIPTGSLFNNNNNLVTINGNGIQFNVSGIYQITTTLQFTGSSITGGTETFAFSYSISSNNGTQNLSSSSNGIAGPISFLDGSNNVILGATPLFINGSASGGGANLSNGFTSSNYGGQVALTTTTNNTCPFFLLPNYMTSSIKQNVNTITSIYYIPAPTTIYFNIANTLSTNSLNATGNFTAQLLNYVVVPIVTNNSNLTVSTLNYTNGYYYYTFVPTTTTSSGTATITFTGNVAMNYLLVGGGGGGGGSHYVSSSNYYGGGGGGGGQVSNSISAISGNTFNITVGGGGSGGGASTSGTIGGNTILNTVTASGGGGGLTNPTPTGGTGGVTNGGNGYSLVNSVITNATSGGTTQPITLSGINLSYSVGGAGGGGGGSLTYGAQGGINNFGGANGGNINSSGGNGSGNGTGGGGATVYNSTAYNGGQGGPGFAVLYWAA